MVWVLEKATFIALGGDVLDTPVVRIDRPAGHVRQIEVSGGRQPFPDDYIVEVHVTDFHVTDHGGQRGSDAPVRDEPARGALACLGIRVFACDEDYISDIPRYEYRPTRPEPNASLHGPVNRRADGPADGIGVEFMCFPATALVSQDGGPDLNSVFVAPGQDIAHARKAVFYGSDQPADQSGRRAWQGDRLAPR